MAFKAFDLSGKVALVTGGNGGIGLGMAEALAEAGAEIAIWGTNAEKNEAARARLAAAGPKITTAQVDVGDSAAVNEAFARTLAAHGRVDSVFANAGVSGRHAGGGFAEMTDEEWRRVMRVNLDGVFYTFRAACRHMVERGGGGSLVVTASMAARQGAARAEHYGASKAAVITMIQGLAVEYARHGIRANAILPGWTESDMTDGLFRNEKFAANVLPRTPLRRWGTAADFGGIAIYFASDASSWHTADSVLIDGGYLHF